MVAYDVTDADSFQHLETWLDTIKQVRKDVMHFSCHDIKIFS